MQASPAEALKSARDALASAADRAHEMLDSCGVSDAELIEMLRTTGHVQRRVEATLVALAGEVQARSEGPKSERFTVRHGARSTTELVQATTLCDIRSARRVQRAAQVARRAVAVTTGELLPGDFPALTDALRDGAVGVDGLLAASKPLAEAKARIAPEVFAAADAALAAAARGTEPGPGLEAAPALDANGLAYLAHGLAAYADPDGAEPTEDAAMRRRSLRLGEERDGLVPLRGDLLPDVAAQLLRLIDAVTNPRSNAGALLDEDPRSGASGDHDGNVPAAYSGSDAEALAEASISAHHRDDGTPADIDGRGAGDEAKAHGHEHGDACGCPNCGNEPVDPRTSAQKQHDALAAILGVAAASADAGTIGGAPPTLVITMNAKDFADGTGWAHAEGITAPTSFAAAQRVACAGAITRVIHDDKGTIRAIETLDRVFNAHQRRAIAARDRECIVPGCHVRPTWCEVHHIEQWCHGGRTHTGCGVLLCWHHHRNLGVNGWDIRIHNGLPQVRGPAWWDPDRVWRPVHTPLARTG